MDDQALFSEPADMNVMALQDLDAPHILQRFKKKRPGFPGRVHVT
jgi:hypothetical protein